MVLASKNFILLKWPPQHRRLTMRKEVIRITCLKLYNKAYIFLSSNFITFFLCFIDVINFFNQNCLILQQNWLYIKSKNLCHQQWQQNNVNLACFITITTRSFLKNWRWKMLYEEQNTQWNHYINMLKLLKV